MRVLFSDIVVTCDTCLYKVSCSLSPHLKYYDVLMQNIRSLLNFILASSHICLCCLNTGVIRIHALCGRESIVKYHTMFLAYIL